jgi:hypothetical protein
MRRSLLILTVLVLLAAATSALATTTVKPGSVYVGKTTQGIPVRLAAQVNGLRWFRYRAKMTCNDGSTFLDDFFSDDVTVTDNRFSVSYTSNAGAITTKVTGTLAGAKASGTVRIIERYSQVAVNGVTPLAANGSIVCDSKTVKWSAKS